MWFLGLILGAIVGGAMGDSGGAWVGAISGFIIGLMSRRKPSASNLEERLRTLEDAVQYMGKRISTMEDRVSTPPPVSPPSRTPHRPPPVDVAETAIPNPPPSISKPEAPLREHHRVREHRLASERIPREEPKGWDARAWLMGHLEGNLTAKVGMMILFLGVGFLLKYAYEHDWIPVPVRLAGVAMAGCVMFGIGLRLMTTRRVYALLLQGGGIGLLYLDTFFALRLYSMISQGMGLAFFAVLGVACLGLALARDAKVLAVFGLLGAFLAPVLSGAQAPDPTLLFSYLAFLNVLIVVASWFKAWRDLNLVGFLFTFFICLYWGYYQYEPHLFAKVETFLVIFGLMYLVIPILFASRQPLHLRGLVDGTLVFGMPMAAAYVQAILVKGMEDGLAWSSGIASCVYFMSTILLWNRTFMRVLAEAHLALAVLLGTLTVPFALDAYPTFAFWTLEGAAIVWIGLRQERVLARIFGLLLQGAGALHFLMEYDNINMSNPWFNDFILGCLLVALASLLTSGLMHRYKGILIRGGEEVGVFFLLWGILWWFVGGLHMLRHGLADDRVAGGVLMFSAASIFLAESMGRWLAWPGLRRVQILLGFIMTWMAMTQLWNGHHPCTGMGWLGWPEAFLVLYFVLYCQREGVAFFSGFQHALGQLLMATLLAWEMATQWQLTGFGSSWSLASWGLVPAAMIGINSRMGTSARWPWGAHRTVHLEVVPCFLTLFCLYWSVKAFADSAHLDPWGYLPFLNILELSQFAVAGAVVAWSLALRRSGSPSELPESFILSSLTAAILAFAAMNSVVMRSVHHWAGVSYSLEGFLHSVLAQAAFSLLWTLTALALMILARKRAQRSMWMAGAAILLMVVVKLFVLDLEGSGSVERIVSFLGTGFGMLAIGYFAPIPIKHHTSIT